MYQWMLHGSMEAQHESKSAQDSNITVAVNWFELDQIHTAIEDYGTRVEISELAEKALEDENNEVVVSWWDIDGWAKHVDKDNDKSCNLIRELSEKAQN